MDCKPFFFNPHDDLISFIISSTSGTGSDNALKDLSSPWNPGKNTTERIFDFAIDKRLTPRLDSSLGYYYYKSPYSHLAQKQLSKARHIVAP